MVRQPVPDDEVLELARLGQDAAVGRPRDARVGTIRDTVMGISTRPAPVTNPAPVSANGALNSP